MREENTGRRKEISYALTYTEMKNEYQARVYRAYHPKAGDKAFKVKISQGVAGACSR